MTENLQRCDYANSSVQQVNTIKLNRLTLHKVKDKSDHKKLVMIQRSTIDETESISSPNTSCLFSAFGRGHEGRRLIENFPA